MGLLFQPRHPASEQRVEPRADPPLDTPKERDLTFRAALEAVVLGDTSRFHEFFTEDVRFSSPHVAVASRVGAQAALGVPESSLSDVEIVVRSIEVVGDKLMAEWRLDATFTNALLFDDSLLIEATGTSVHLSGASVAEFRGQRIEAFRHYFDDSELLDHLPGVPSNVRWTTRDYGSPPG